MATLSVRMPTIRTGSEVRLFDLLPTLENDTNASNRLPQYQAVSREIVAGLTL